MKKLFAITALSLATLSASALEVGVVGGRDFSGGDRNYGGVTVGRTVGPVNATLGFARTAVGNNDQNRWSLAGGYTVASVGPVSITPTLGVVYLDNQRSDNGLAAVAGVELSAPVVKNVRAVVDWSYQIGQSRVSSSDGNRVGVSVRYKF